MAKILLFLLLLGLFIIPERVEIHPNSINIDPLQITDPPFTYTYDYPNIAFVKPVFTSAAYNGYYRCFSSDTNYQTCFDQVVIDSWSTSQAAENFIYSLINEGYPESKITIIDDVKVHKGEIFGDNGRPLYDSIVFFHNEYVTMREYHNMINFIKAGGNVVILNGNAFFAEVIYDESTNHVKLVSGHGWNFDGENGTKADVYKSRFRNGVYNNEHQFWFGSRYTAFSLGQTNGATFRVNGSNTHPIALEMSKQGISTMATNYISHEENSMITPNAHIIADWDTEFEQKDRGIKIYEFFPEGPYGGSLIHFGFFGTDILFADINSRKTFVTAVRHQAGFYNHPWIKYPNNNAVLNKDVILEYTQGWKTKVYINDVLYPNIKRGSNLDFLGEGTHELEIEFNSANIIIKKSVLFNIDRTPPSFLFNQESNFKMPEDYPNTPLQISLNDLNADYMRIRVTTAYGDNLYATENGESLSINYARTFPDGKFLSLEGIDSAGNSVIKWYPFNSTSKINATRELQPDLQKLNSTHLRMGFPIISANVSGRLQISEDFGANWMNIPFTEKNITADREYAYYEKNTSEFLYRIAITTEGQTHYVNNIKSYHWDNTVYSIQNHNITTYMSEGAKFEFQIGKSQLQNTSVKVQWYNDDSTLLETEDLGYSISDNSTFIGTVPENQEGVKTIRILLISNILNWSYDFSVVLTDQPALQQLVFDVPTGVEQYFDPNNLTQEISIIHVMEISYILDGKDVVERIDYGSFQNLTFTLRIDSEIMLYFYDNMGNTLYQIEFNKIFDEIPPNIVGLNEIYITPDEADNYTIFWQISDISPKIYGVYFEGELIQNGDYENGVSVSTTLVSSLVGTYNYTVFALDNSGNSNSFTTIVHIAHDISTPTINSSQPSTNNESDNPGFLLLSSITFLVIFVRFSKIKNRVE